jgi:hypothetical protein
MISGQARQRSTRHSLGVSTIEPTILLATLLRFGLDQLFEKFEESRKAKVHNLVEPGGLGSELRAYFKVSAALQTSLVIVGLERGDAWRTCVPIKYGEALRVRVQRGIYQVTAWFFATAHAPAAKLTLVAIAKTDIVVASSRAEKFVLMGEEPQPSEVAAIRNAAPLERPFILPGDEPKMLPAAGRQLEIAAAPQLEILSSPACSHEDSAGQRCLGWPDEGESSCHLHAGHTQEGGERDIEILGWVGTHAFHAAQGV